MPCTNKKRKTNDSELMVVVVVVVLHSTPPDNLSIQEFQSNEAVDVEVRRPRM